MSLKKSAGNMYKWVDYTHNHLGGECPHRCCYCYVDSPRFGRPERYQGAIRLIEDEFRVRYGTGRTIFVENMNDLFAEDIPSSFIVRVLEHCRAWPGNTFVFQSKNPARFHDFLKLIPAGSVLGTTIETNRDLAHVASAPSPHGRLQGMQGLPFRTFVTIEPILAFDLQPLADGLAALQPRPSFVNVGADSKAHGLREPSQGEVSALLAELRRRGLEVREKSNLTRLVAES